jgi:hypothetical protein
LLNGAVSCLVPLLPVYAYQLSAAGAAPALERYLGRSQVSSDAAQLARELSLTDIVSDDRDILADMFFTLRGEVFTSMPALAPARQEATMTRSSPHLWTWPIPCFSYRPVRPFAGPGSSFWQEPGSRAAATTMARPSTPIEWTRHA